MQAVEPVPTDSVGNDAVPDIRIGVKLIFNLFIQIGHVCSICSMFKAAVSGDDLVNSFGRDEEYIL